MIVIPLDSILTFQLMLGSAIFEFFRILIGYVLGKPPDKIRTLTIEKIEAQKELAQIKSVQLELVKHSLLTRKIIKIEKEIDKLNLSVQPMSVKIKYYFRILRVVLYISVGIYFYNSRLLLINPQLLWPLSWFTSKSLVQVPAWFLLFSTGLASRHILRTLLQVIYRSSTFS